MKQETQKSTAHAKNLVSIVLINWNGERFLHECIRSIHHQILLTQRKRQETARNFSRKIAEAAIPDYYEVVEKMNNVVLFSPETIEVMQELQNGPQVVHYLGNHLDIADKISGLGPLQAAAELGRISARLGDSPSKNKQTTKAPPPVEPVAGGAGSLSKSYEEMSMSEIMADDRI